MVLDLNIAMNQARRAVAQARQAAHIPQAPQPSNKPVVVVRNGQRMLDTYNSNRNKLYSNTVLKPSRYIPMVQPRTQTITVRKELPAVSNSTSFGTGMFQGKLSVPINTDIKLR